LLPAIDSLLNAYVDRHARYRSESLIAPIAKYRLIDFANQPFEVLEQFTDSPDLSAADKIAVLRRVLYLNQQQPPERRNDWMLEMWRQQLASLLLDANDLTGARALLASVPQTHRAQFLELELRISAKAGELSRLLENYRRNPTDAPGFDALRNAAEPFTRRHEEPVADQILAFAYSRELDNGNFAASNFLGLAEIRLKANDIAGATQLLRRMQLVADEPFQDLIPAADLLEKYGHKTEAAEYIQARARVVPWDAKARLRLGRDQNVIAADANTPYLTRVEAAKSGGTGGEGELALLARGHITAAEANHPFYYEARLEAAQNAADPAARVPLLLDAIAVHPGTHLLDLFQSANRSGKLELAIAAAMQIRESLPLAEAREAASAFERAGDYSSAQRTLESSQSLEASPQIHEQLKQEIAAIEHRAEIHRQNEARRPHVSASVAQDHVVRPRIEK
jgi:hypothetical protein